MLKTANSGVRDVPFGIDDPEKVPAPRYFSQEFFDAEVEHLWPHVWQMACRLEQIPNVGDWIEYSNVGKSVIVVRTKDGVKAHQNHCRHRGVPIAGGKGNEHGNCAKTGFVCPFHGWRWNMDGDCTFVYGKQLFNQDLLEKDELALKPVRCETWGGYVYINHDADAPSFRESMGPVLKALEARGMDKVRAEWCYGAVLPSNWKIAMEAFMEGYHVMKTHPQLQHAQPSLYNARYGNETGGLGPLVNPNLSVRENVQECLTSMELLSTGMAGLVHSKEVEIAKQFADVELPEDPQEAMMTWFGIVGAAITKQLRERGEDVPDLNKVMAEEPIEAVTYLFPHHFILTYFTGMSSYRIRPLTPETCLFEIWSLALRPERAAYDTPSAPIMLPYDSPEFPEIPMQDYSNLPIQQQGLHAGKFDFMRLSKEQEGMISNYQRLIDGYLAGMDSATLAKATNVVNSGYNAPIPDIGF